MRKLLKDTKYFSQINLNKNKNINFNKLAYRSGIKIWWLCSKGHSYRATPHHKTRGRKCPYCTTGTKKVSIEKSILKIKPELAKLWHPTKNGNFKPSEVNAGSRKRCWFLCKKGHEFKISPHQKGYRFTCPYCSGKKVTHDNSLEYLYPLIAKEWYPKKISLNQKIILQEATIRLGGYAKKTIYINSQLKLRLVWVILVPNAIPKFLKFS